MKQLIKITSILSLIFLFSCSPTNQELQLKSPEGNFEINLKGVKANAFEPFNVTLQLKGYEQERSLTLDMYNSELTAETVVVDWKDENSCVLTLKQSDGDNRVLDIYLSGQEVRLQERGKGELNLVNPLLGL